MAGQLQKTRRDGADVTWHSRHAGGDWKSMDADSRRLCMTDDL